MNTDKIKSHKLEKDYRHSVEISPFDKTNVKVILNAIVQHIAPLGEPWADNETLNEFVSDLIVMLDDILEEGNLSYYLDEDNHLFLKTKINFIKK